MSGAGAHVPGQAPAAAVAPITCAAQAVRAHAEVRRARAPDQAPAAAPTPAAAAAAAPAAAPRARAPAAACLSARHVLQRQALAAHLQQSA